MHFVADAVDNVFVGLSVGGKYSKVVHGALPSQPNEWGDFRDRPLAENGPAFDWL